MRSRPPSTKDACQRTVLQSYLKLQDELGYLARQQDERAQLEEKRRNKIMGKALKQHLKSKPVRPATPVENDAQRGSCS